MTKTKIWMYVLFAFSAFFFVLATYSIYLIIIVHPVFHLHLLYRAIAGYFIAFVLYYIAAQKRKCAKK